MRSPWADRHRGSVTAEFAVVLPAVLVVLTLCLGAVQVVGQQVRLTDAAGSAARLLARGESPARAAGLVDGLGLHATVAAEPVGEFVCARLSAPSGFAPFAAAGLTLGARSCALAGLP
ncbi:TadE family type IV pilus minor pilin [Cryobacterium sp. SO2]|uniref:TadE family type IV pilus minor pilin n=1 Tax=Cryobacterium sp. SO2 TaxID=1897060 RepID=UPI00223D6545|nr:TadE family type IV pilus minor pilin [Cryobacterium sp. SO2]WEO78024.1 TadE family type IV pilus minor pilin [Cryobacterium sp. SO2]